MSDQLTFDGIPPAPTPTIAATQLSYGQRLTIRNRQQIERGIHPATNQPLHTDTTLTCAGCIHHHRYTWHNGTYHKCARHRLGESHGEASDIRTSWPACAMYEAEQ